jgi:hypothetical protein
MTKTKSWGVSVADFFMMTTKSKTKTEVLLLQLGNKKGKIANVYYFTLLIFGSTLSLRSAEQNKEATDSSLTIDTANLIPLTIQSGFSVPEGIFPGTPRFKLAYGTSTVITTSTSTATRSLIIFCSSITDYQVCSGTG